MISFILNLPYTIAGLVAALISVPTSLKIKRSPYVFIINIQKFWWIFGYMKNARAMTIGHVILLGPTEEENDLEHELVHVRQYSKYPLIFPFFYYLELMVKGYKNNRFEIEAYHLSNSVYRGK